MNDCCPIAPPSSIARPEAVAQATPAETPAARGLLASLKMMIKETRFVSVDLTDAIFANLPRRDGAPYEAVVPPNCSE